MRLRPLPRWASWTHVGVRDGFEVLFADERPNGTTLRGATTAVEGSSAWTVSYVIDLDTAWRTMRVVASNSTAAGTFSRTMERIAGDRWAVDGRHAPELDGCLDVDLESSSVTNTVPVHRLPVEPGVTTQAPAAFVRADDLGVMRIEQDYTLVSETAGKIMFDYASITFDFACQLTYDPSGLIIDYPGIAARHT